MKCVLPEENTIVPDSQHAGRHNKVALAQGQSIVLWFAYMLDIAGARSFSVWEADVDDKVNALYEERSDPAEQNKPIVIYCSGGACEDSHMLAQKLWGIQFNNVYVYKDGFPDWQKRALPVRTGATP